MFLPPNRCLLSQGSSCVVQTAHFLLLNSCLQDYISMARWTSSGANIVRIAFKPLEYILVDNTHVRERVREKERYKELVLSVSNSHLTSNHTVVRPPKERLDLQSQAVVPRDQVLCRGLFCWWVCFLCVYCALRFFLLFFFPLSLLWESLKGLSDKGLNAHVAKQCVL